MKPSAPNSHLEEDPHDSEQVLRKDLDEVATQNVAATSVSTNWPSSDKTEKYQESKTTTEQRARASMEP